MQGFGGGQKMMLQEFDRFLVELAGLSVSDDVKRIANIILKHMEELVPLGTAKGLRSKKIIEYAQTEFVETVPGITVKTESN